MRTLILYSRPECHLCEALRDELAPLVAGRAAVDVVDVSGSVALERRYGLRIPVLVDRETEREVSGYPLDRESVANYLETQ
jgi:hypothetical protein